eukprot:TRINITY_DN1125_c0_g1_i2.p1 TRINITY_DN1125_c0_g1~~TRINITY_DN1125_c0_g1_i2.p1  ORF type:complete len:151 (+),score=27.46 TRINITY_DN1125_c0_g1_i2:286-738(+)
MKIEWSVRLNKTAGKTLCRKVATETVDASSGKRITKMVNIASIELATKVVDDPDKLRSTLCHELCHAAAWLIDNNINPPHGPIFRKWASRAMHKYPGLKVSTCHNYEIKYKYQWRCSNSNCKQIVGRHSKSLDVSKVLCGRCSSSFVPLF